MSHKIVDFGQSARARLLALANRQGIQLEYVLLRYALERFLYRLGVSAYADRFVLKGASAFAVWIGPFCRVTRDADLEAFGDMTPEALLDAFREICAIQCPADGVEFDFASFHTEEIKREDKYPGTRLTFGAGIGGAKVLLQFDIGVGDSVYPCAEFLDYPTLLTGERPHVRVYPRYTVVAEKFQVMVSRGLVNSRLKDYHDLWVLTERFDFDGKILQTAIEYTFARRMTIIPSTLPEGLDKTFYENPAKQMQWNAFLRRAGVARLELPVIVGRLVEFVRPIIEGKAKSLCWDSARRVWKKNDK